PDRPALIYACGHSRNGILLGPLTATCVAALVLGQPSPADLSPFEVTRFAGSMAAAGGAGGGGAAGGGGSTTAA
ncbi:MAG: hypothetical protein ACYC2G_16015, partial [Gemmatimonadaceae bacterium]